MTVKASNTIPARDSTGESDLRVITVRVGNELLCLDILSVVEIVRTADLRMTRVPNAHTNVLGVVNLRGKVLPVLDLGGCLGQPAHGARERLVVVEMGSSIAGLSVDEVAKVVSISRSDLGESVTARGHHGTPLTVAGHIMTFIDVGTVVAAAGGG